MLKDGQLGKSCVGRESFREDWSLYWAAFNGGGGEGEGNWPFKALSELEAGSKRQ